MLNMFIKTVVATTLLTCVPVMADESTQEQRIADLEKRVTELELRLEEISADDRWKDTAIWARIKKEMSTKEVRKILGKPARIEKAIFTTWYYHATSKLHSFVWFDEDKVLGWETPK